MSSDKNDILIYVTGFGLFPGHTQINASWEAVKLLPSKITINTFQCHIKTMEVPVAYRDVDKAVENIWKENPKLVIHCGVYGDGHFNKNDIRLEKCAYNNCFTCSDCNGDFLKDKMVQICSQYDHEADATCDATSFKLSTKLNVDKLATELNCNRLAENCQYTASQEIGRYLCCYIYLKSLDINSDRTIFVHVPPVDKPYTSAETSKALLAIIKECLGQLQKQGKI